MRGILPPKPRCEQMQLLRNAAIHDIPRRFHTEAHFVHTLLTPRETLAQRGERRIDTEPRKIVTRLHQAITAGSMEPLSQLLNLLLNIVQCAGDDLGCRGWSGSTEICDKIGNGEIRFVADSGNNRQG